MEIGLGRKSNSENKGFFDRYEKSLKGFFLRAEGCIAERVREQKESAWKSFIAEGLPTGKNELFKYTNLKDIESYPLEAPGNVNLAEVNATAVLAQYKNFESYKLVFLNGTFVPKLSDIDVLPKGIYIGPFSSLFVGKGSWLEGFMEPEQIAKELDELFEYKRTVFESLNRSLFEEGAFIGIGPNIKCDKPIQIIHLSSGSSEGDDGWAIYPRNIILALENSKAEVLECFHSLDNNPYFCNALTEVKLFSGAKIEYLKTEEESLASQHISGVQAIVGKDASFSAFTLCFGSMLSRTHCDVYLKGVGAAAHLNGLYIGQGEQHIDNSTLIVHEKPNGYSRQLYKGILNDKSHGVFNGKIFIQQEAQKTDSAQMNKNLLLSKKAQVDTKPELEVYADDVKANHGSAVGQLDSSQLFYFLSRGISKEQGLAMLSKGYASEVVLKIEALSLKDLVLSKLERVKW